MRTSLYKNSKTVRAMVTGAKVVGSSPYNGDTVDLLQTGAGDYRTALFAILTGTLTDGAMTLVLQDSDDGTTWGTADAADTQGGTPTIALTDDDAIKEVGYSGRKRYCRIVLTVGAGATGGVLGAVAVLYGTSGWRR